MAGAEDEKYDGSEKFLDLVIGDEVARFDRKLAPGVNNPVLLPRGGIDTGRIILELRRDPEINPFIVWKEIPAPTLPSGVKFPGPPKGLPVFPKAKEIEVRLALRKVLNEILKERFGGR